MVRVFLLIFRKEVPLVINSFLWESSLQTRHLDVWCPIVEAELGPLHTL